MIETVETPCLPIPVDPDGFNPNTSLPYGLTANHVRDAMCEFVDFLTFLCEQLHGRGIPSLETMLMPANFSSMVGEFMGANIPKYCPSLAKNQYHNGHPDLIPSGIFDKNSVQYSHEGVEIKASRYTSGWQGHNPENVFLMVFVFDSGRPTDAAKSIGPVPFRFVSVVGAQLELEDWVYAGRSETSRRTITASVTRTGYEKMMANWIYRAPGVTVVEEADLGLPLLSEQP